ncbi:hypothetical protein [Zobellia laminariae]|uniref:hypothetical protein n=1 Tax=Zobellia laminariae TaxID=248906 RepID=UPI0026F40C64|nr:hypothetical protein [Zobellia laminariae]WKX76704.1 hypothetical protein Q5W13_00555 [Zobellia laminariae]
MISENKISKFTGLLISSTKNGEVVWTDSIIRKIDSLEGEQSIIGKVYETEFKEKYLRLYKYNEPVQVDEFQYLTRTFYKLEFIDGNDKNLWTFPNYIRELQDLYETVQIKSSGLDKFFDDIIPDNSFDF